MKTRRIPNSHLITFAHYYKDVNGIAQVRMLNAKSYNCIGDNKYRVLIEDTKNYYFADDVSYNKYIEVLANHGYSHIQAIHGVTIDNHGNVIIGNKLITPAKFFKGVDCCGCPIRMDRAGNSSVTSKAVNKTWLLRGTTSWYDKDSAYERTCFLTGRGKGGKGEVFNTSNVDLITEIAAKSYIKNHPYLANFYRLEAISLLDYLSL